jgi:hypothetical protein
VIDLDDRQGLCPGLTPESAGPLAFRACVALERRHRPGVRLSLSGDAEAEVAIQWELLPVNVAATEDRNEATRDGAMGLALALAHRHRHWEVVRRLQSTVGEGADWLLSDTSRSMFILEVKGTDEGPLPLAEAKSQARASIWARRATPAVCVIRFLEPQAIFETDEPQ